MEAGALAERIARDSYGKLLALLAARFRDVAAAEDALADAFAAALQAWPRSGPPDNPEAWLFAAARRRLLDRARRSKTAAEGEARLVLAVEELEAEMAEAIALPDRRLGLMFACAHPALDPGVRTALMLQAVLGLNAERIAAAFLVEPAAMGQRLVRAKRKLKEAGAPFELPPRDAWPERLPGVLDAIYAGYAEGWGDPLGADRTRRDLAEEAIFLARLVAAAIPEEPEPLGLLALLLHLEARRPARRDANGRYVPLSEQDVALWSQPLIAEAERTLARAARAGRPGRFQLEAAIQSAHAARAWIGRTDWAAIAALYGALVQMTGSPVAALNRAAALAEAQAPQAGLDALAPLEAALADYQPFWAMKAHLLALTGAPEAARAAYAEAIARERDPAVAAWLQEKSARLPP